MYGMHSDSAVYNAAVNLIGPASVESFRDVLTKWRVDGLEFVHTKLPRIVGLVIVGFILIRIIKLVSTRLVHLSKSQELPTGLRAQQLRTLSSVIYSVGMFVIVFLTAMGILDQIGLDVRPLLASAGIVGLAVGFGAQTLVHDFINGFFILVENQFDLGDTVKIGAVQGTVETMTLRRTLLRDADGTVHTIPNSTITVVSNLTRDWTQLALHVTTDYQEDTDKVVSLLRQVAADVRNDPQFSDVIVADPQVPGIERVTAGEVDYLVTVKTRPGQQYAVSRELRRQIKTCFEKNNIRPGGQNRFYVVDSTMPSTPK